MGNKPSSLRAKSRIWIELRDEVVFGLGRIRLLEAVEQTGSISKAATLLGMSYRAAWGKISATEERLRLPLVERQQGLRNTKLTPVGRDLLVKYKQFQKKAEQSVDDIFEEQLGGLLSHLKDTNFDEK